MSEADAAQTPPASPAPPKVRQPTFLARYPRKLKLFVVAALLLSVTGGFYQVHHHDKTPVHEDDIDAAFERAKAKTQAESLAADDALPSENKGGDANSGLAESLPPLPAGEEIEAAIRENDADDRDARMPSAPDPALTEKIGEGYLPRIGVDGRRPWQAYARPFNAADPRPRIAIVMMDMGLSNIATMATLDRLPAVITLAFDAQGAIVSSWMERAHQMGHETLLSVPMEPADYPRSDPGSKALLNRLSDNDNIERLHHAMKQGAGYVGVTSFSGSRFLNESDKMKIVLDVLKERGLLYLDPTLSQHAPAINLAKERKIPFAVSVRKIDERQTAADIDAALRQLEQSARLTGKAVAFAEPLPLTLDRLDRWIKLLPSHHIVLAPISAVVE